MDLIKFISNEAGVLNKHRMYAESDAYDVHGLLLWRFETVPFYDILIMRRFRYETPTLWNSHVMWCGDLLC